MPPIRIPCPKYPNPNFGEIFCPELEIGVKLADGGYQPIEFILDSGADCTIVPRHMADLTGFSLPPQPDAELRGIFGPSQPAFTGRMTMKIQSEEFEVRCLFTESNETPFLLGRLDFLSLFNVKFDGGNCHITLERVA